MSAIFEDMVSAIVRPPRAIYAPLDLGPNRLRCRGVEYKRLDFETLNDRSQKIKGSLWALMHKHSQPGNNDFCILYLHPNSGSRVDVVRTKIMAVAAQSQCAVCSFDFSGCGLSDGDYISLGVREKEDVCAVMTYLIEQGFRRFMLWGRSMGAATSVMFYGAYKPLLEGAVVSMLLDSPFTSFEGLADDYTQSKINIPRLLLSPAVHYLKKIVEQKYNFNLMQMSPISVAHEVDILTVVLSGKDDKIVSPKLSEEMYSSLGGPKLRIYFEGGHNTHRPPEIFEAIQETVHSSLHQLASLEVLTRLETMLQPQGSTSKSMTTVQKGVNLNGTSGKLSIRNPSSSSEEIAMKKIDDIFAPISASSRDNRSPAVAVQSPSPHAGSSPSLRREMSDLTPEEMDKEAQLIAKETEEAFTNLLKTKSLKKLTHTDVHLAFNSARMDESGGIHETNTDVSVNKDSGTDENGTTYVVESSVVTRTTDERSNAATKGAASNVNKSHINSDYNMLFGSETKGPGLMGDFPTAASSSPRSGAGSASPHTDSASKRDTLGRWPHNHAPPGTSVAGSHLAKSRGKPSTVISVSMGCPEVKHESRVSPDGSRHSTSTSSSVNAVISNPNKDTAESTESSWLGVLSMGYLGTAADPEPCDKAVKYSSTFCPPVPSAWNKLASVRAATRVEDDIVDLTVDMAVSISFELIKGKFNIPANLPEDQFGILLSLAVAEVFAEVGSSFSVENDTISWTRAIQSFIDVPEGFKARSAVNSLERVGVITPCPSVLKKQASLSSNSSTESLTVGVPSKKGKSYSSLHSMSASSALHGSSVVAGNTSRANGRVDLHVPIPVVASHAHVNIPHSVNHIGSAGATLGVVSAKNGSSAGGHSPVVKKQTDATADSY